MQGTVSDMSVTQMMATYGSKIERLADGRSYHITSDEKGRSVVGPEVVPSTDGTRRKTWFSRRPKVASVEEQAGEVLRNVLGDVPRAVQSAAKNISDMYGHPSGEVPPSPSPQGNRFTRWVRARRDQAQDYFWMAEWHKAVQHCALDVVVWAFSISTVIVLGKVVLWIVTMG